jgi:hypothetical protein
MNLFRKRRKSDLPSLTPNQVEALSRFASFEIGLDAMLRSMDGIFTFKFQGTIRTSSTKFKVPEPGILITRSHIENACERRRLGSVSEEELMKWATVILLNNAYEIDEENQDFISDWLNELSANPHTT